MQRQTSKKFDRQPTLTRNASNRSFGKADDPSRPSIAEAFWAAGNEPPLSRGASFYMANGTSGPPAMQKRTSIKGAPRLDKNLSGLHYDGPQDMYYGDVPLPNLNQLQSISMPRTISDLPPLNPLKRTASKKSQCDTIGECQNPEQYAANSPTIKPLTRKNSRLANQVNLNNNLMSGSMMINPFNPSPAPMPNFGPLTTMGSLPNLSKKDSKNYGSQQKMAGMFADFMERKASGGAGSLGQ